jgi:hypothetical protein
MTKRNSGLEHICDCLTVVVARSGSEDLNQCYEEMRNASHFGELREGNFLLLSQQAHHVANSISTTPFHITIESGRRRTMLVQTLRATSHGGEPDSHDCNRNFTCTPPTQACETQTFEPNASQAGRQRSGSFLSFSQHERRFPNSSGVFARAASIC